MIKIIIFDMDGTLYKNDAIRQKFAEAAYHTLAKFKKISLKSAQTLVEDKREKLRKKSGGSVPYTLTLLSFGIPIEFWHEENIKFFDPRNYLVKDEKLKKSLDRLKNHFRLTILTNNNRIQTDRILEALDLGDIFDKIYTYNSFRLLKPNIEFFKNATIDLKVKPEHCLSVGDRYNVDLGPAKELGMQVFEVKGPENIYNLSEKIKTLK